MSDDDRKEPRKWEERSNHSRDQRPRSGDGRRREGGRGGRREGGGRPQGGSLRSSDEGKQGGRRYGRDNRRDNERPSYGRRRSDERAGAEVRQQAEPDGPPIADDVAPTELDGEVLDALSSLSSGARKAVIGHLVMAARSIDDDAELAFTHAMVARRIAARVGVVREAAGVAAYQAGHYEDALRELRAARRMTGVADHLPIMADSERGLGRPRRALDLADDPAVRTLDDQGRTEMLIVAAGARRDLGDVDSAAAMLQVPELRLTDPWVSRLRYAYADALVAAGRIADAKLWFERAAEVDVDHVTDAEARARDLT